MKRRYLFCYLAALAMAISADGRRVHIWSEAELAKASDLVVIGRPIKVQILEESSSLGWKGTDTFRPRFRGVETTFKVLDVFKGMPANDQVVLHHYRYETTWGSPPNGPSFLSFAPDGTNTYVLYLVKEGADKYAPVTGQTDAAGSIKAPPTNSFDFPLLPPIADTDPSVRYPVEVRVPARLRLERQQHSIMIKTDELALTNLTVGSNMVTGTQCEAKIYQGGKFLNDAGSSLQGGLTDGGYGHRIDGDIFKLPPHGESYTIVVSLKMFETDEPAQHFWSPQSGRKYKVLWEKTFRLDVERSEK